MTAKRSPPPRQAFHYLHEPDYTRPLLEFTPEQRASILDKLEILYGKRRAKTCFVEIERLMKVFYAHKTVEGLALDRAFDRANRFTHEDVILITYGDLLLGPDASPLATLRDFLEKTMRGTINTVHILPFFTSSSDRGFAIIDYEEVDPGLGTWQEVAYLAEDFRLMFDGVFNHVSSKSRWFQRFLNGRPGFDDFFISFPAPDAIGKKWRRLILRPRTSNLLTRFETIRGPRWVWTTFSPDQIDLNFKNERVLHRVVEILLFYVRRGADLIRLDAVAYIWRDLGTRCAHLPEAHALVQLFRSILDVVAPQVALVTETNVPHEDNVSYFGDGTNEAQMVYNFALPPLVLHTFHTGDCTSLSAWATRLRRHSNTATYMNFLDSHDGVGLMGVQGILSSEQVAGLVERAKAHRGLVSYRDAGDGTEMPYELNLTWYSALNREDAGESTALQVARFIASRAIAFVLPGVPSIYLPSLFGSQNDSAAILAGGEPRSINRRALNTTMLHALLADRTSSAHRVSTRMRRLVEERKRIDAFHPNAAHRVLATGTEVFGLERWTADGKSRVVALVNVTAQPRQVSLGHDDLGDDASAWRDVLSSRRLATSAGVLAVGLSPYEVMWLVPLSK